MIEQNEVIMDGENYRSSGTDSYKEIVLKQVSRIASLGSKEMREGFWIRQVIPNMNQTQPIKYIGDSRKELTQSIEILTDLLHSKFDKKAKEEIDKVEEDIEEHFKNSKEKSYWRIKLKLYRNMFRSLCRFLERFGWLESESIVE